MRRFLSSAKVNVIGAFLAASIAFFASRSAEAACGPNMVDSDCPTAACGGDVCQWSSSGMACVTAGTDPQGQDGWCTSDADCKCKANGATCNASSHCTCTTPAGCSALGGGTAGTGAAGTGGSHAGTGGSTTDSGGGGCSVAPGAAGTGAGLGLGLALGLGALVRRRRRR